MKKPDDLTDIIESQLKIEKAFRELRKITRQKEKPTCFFMSKSLFNELIKDKK